MNELLEQALANKEAILLGLSGIVGGLIVLAALTKTDKDDKALGVVAKLLDLLSGKKKKDAE